MNTRLAVLATLALCAGACTPFALSPPARALPLESSATLAPGRVAVQASGGWHNAARDGGNATVGARIGVAEHVELQGEASYLHVDYGDERSPYGGAGRVGVKLAPVEHVAFVLGVGAGGHAYGGFVAPDAGVVLAYENPYVIPWGAFRVMFSLPVDPSTVVVSHEDELLPLVPPDTFGWQASTGIRLPVLIDPEDDVTLDFLVGAALTYLYGLDGQFQHGFLQAAGALELAFGP